jgi:beta-N-acetylhexosaminidase
VRALACCAVLVMAAATAAGAPARPDAGGPAGSPWDVSRLSLREQTGQLVVTGFPGSRAPASIRARLRRGRVAGVILFGQNARSRRQVRSLTAALQRASGGRALVMTDQEGGQVRRLRFAGPIAAQPGQGNARRVRRLARSSAHALRTVGVNVNLAPVADVPTGRSVMRSRAFGGSPGTVAAKVGASVRGWRSGRVAPTAKHFPGFGAAGRNTDFARVTIRRRLARLSSVDLVPFRAAIRARVPLIMAAHAVYPALDRRRIASQSGAILRGLLRRRMRFRGVVITDALEARAVRARMSPALAAERSVAAGADIALLSDPGDSAAAYARLLRRAQRSAAFRARVRQAAGRVLALKRKLGLRPPR